MRRGNTLWGTPGVQLVLNYIGVYIYRIIGSRVPRGAGPVPLVPAQAQLQMKKATLLVHQALGVLLGIGLLFPAPLAAQIRDELPPAECLANDDRIEVLLLGSYHMANPGLDSFNLEADDVLAPERQAQIQELVERLALFEPTKIAVESPAGDSSVVADYHSHVRGSRELLRSEHEQIGFRLATMLKHQTIYPIDVRMMLNDSLLELLVAANPTHQMRMADLQRFGEQAMAQMADWLTGGTVAEMLYQMNRPEVLAQAHWPYVWILAPIVDGDNYAGADMVGIWYTRNLRIFANLNRIAEPDDRILVVYGQGHIPILSELVEDSPLFCRVDPLPYLGNK